MFASKHRKYKLFPLVNRCVLLSKSLCVQSLSAFFLPYILGANWKSAKTAGNSRLAHSRFPHRRAQKRIGTEKLKSVNRKVGWQSLVLFPLHPQESFRQRVHGAQQQRPRQCAHGGLWFAGSVLFSALLQDTWGPVGCLVAS